MFDPHTGDNLTRDAEAGARLTEEANEDRLEQVEHAQTTGQTVGGGFGDTGGSGGSGGGATRAGAA